MNLYFRLLYVIIVSFFRPRISSILEPADLGFRVLPNDLDLNGHMNNGRYPTIMDLGRMDLILRSGMLKVALKQKGVPILASIKSRFRIPIHVFEPYTLRTHVLCWDDKWAYIEQRFILNKGKKAGAVAAISIVKVGFYDSKAKGMMPTSELLTALNMEGESPPFPDHIVEWQKAEEHLKDVTAEELG